jgi:hypothetical protein
MLVAQRTAIRMSVRLITENVTFTWLKQRRAGHELAILTNTVNAHEISFQEMVKAQKIFIIISKMNIGDSGGRRNLPEPRYPVKFVTDRLPSDRLDLVRSTKTFIIISKILVPTPQGRGAGTEG